MFKRTLTTLLFLLLLAAPLSGFNRNSAAAADKPPADKDAQSAYWKAKARSLLGNRQLVATRDESGRVTSISIISPDGKETGLSFKLRYDERNVLQTMLAADGSKTQFTYDQNGRLQSLAGSDGVTLKIMRDESGKVISMRRAVKPAKVNPAVYRSDSGRAVTYEAAGLRCAAARVGQAAAYTYAAAVCSGLIPGDCAEAWEAYEVTRRWADAVCSIDTEDMEELAQ